MTATIEVACPCCKTTLALPHGVERKTRPCGDNSRDESRRAPILVFAPFEVVPSIPKKYSKTSCNT